MQDIPARYAQIMTYAKGVYPCPKCSNSGRVIIKRFAFGGTRWAECAQCGFRGSYGKTEAGAVRNWNEEAAIGNRNYQA